MCLHNIKLLERNSPNLRRKFLTTLVSNATRQGDTERASKVTGIIHREASQKRWKRVNKTVGKVRGGLTLSVKVPTADGGYNE